MNYSHWKGPTIAKMIFIQVHAFLADQQKLQPINLSIRLQLTRPL